jgi:endonuclease/exonuclease/phosphatase (EEP) superfamily protein YafD
MSREKIAVTWTGVGRGLGVALSCSALVRATRPERFTVDIAISAATPWLVAPSLLLLAGSLLSRRVYLATLATAVVAYQAKCTRPQARPPTSIGTGADGPRLKVGFANVWRSNTDVEGILAELAAGEHDVVALAEVTEHHLDAIASVLPPTTYPWRTIEADGSNGSKGLALVSRFPVVHVEKWWSAGHPQLDGSVLVPGALPFRILVVHTWGPVGRSHIKSWRAQLVDIAARAEGERTVIVGDFNATLQHRSFARLVGTRWSDAASRAFGGWRGTWPANRRWRPALFRIDHILVGPEISIRSGRAWRARGSDHRPVSAVLRLPPSPGG